MQRNPAFSSAMNNGYPSYCIAPSPCVGPPRNQFYPNGPAPQAFQPNTCFMTASVIRKMSNTTPPKGYGRNF
ncbi:hypothetical protein B5X24_HaOG213108 [Helicoverpa armigera]|nr:hypothetical protein B5X24_HaOG213108 [Helicoverpa armigera]